MKKNKTLAYALVATLLVGGTFAGTKAWFTDKESASSDLVITTGTLDLVVEDKTFDGDAWVPVYEKEDGGYTMFFESAKEGASKVESSKDENGNFTNVRPGDVFRKQVIVKNNGSLDQKLTVTGGEDVAGDDFKVDTNVNTINGLKLDGNGGNTYFEIFVEVSKEMIDGKANTNHNRTFDLEKAMEKIIIEANQVNKK